MDDDNSGCCSGSWAVSVVVKAYINVSLHLHLKESKRKPRSGSLILNKQTCLFWITLVLIEKSKIKIILRCEYLHFQVLPAAE